MLCIYLLDPFYFSENAIFVLLKEKRKHARISPDMNDCFINRSVLLISKILQEFSYCQVFYLLFLSVKEFAFRCQGIQAWVGVVHGRENFERG